MLVVVLQTIISLGEQMVQRIRNLHSRGFLHRDIKPENFLMGLGEEENICFLVDFGLARRYRYAQVLVFERFTQFLESSTGWQGRGLEWWEGNFVVSTLRTWIFNERLNDFRRFAALRSFEVFAHKWSQLFSPHLSLSSIFHRSKTQVLSFGLALRYDISFFSTSSKLSRSSFPAAFL